MRLPTSYLPDKVRSAVRFVILGNTGMFVQTGFFLLAMRLLGEPVKDSVLYFVAFGIGFVCEMIPNYFFSNWYTFGTKPSLKNASGFILARIINLGIQFGLLPLLVWLLPNWGNGLLSFLTIFVAGIINYLILLLFFKKKKKEPCDS